MRRRDLLRLLALGTVAGTAACGGGRGGGGAPSRPWAPTNRLRVPPQLAPTAGQVNLTLAAGETAFLPGRPTPTWGINGPYLGPTLRLRQGEDVAFSVKNALPEPTTLHWHGMRLPAVMDGGPHQIIPVGEVWRPRWTVANDASTSWYHPHPHGATAMHVFRGVAGMLIVDGDAAEARALPHTYGVDDIPCILQDRTIDDDGQVPFDTVPTFGQMGTDMLVNGTLDAYVDVTTARVRLRLLNASNARLYHLGIADGRPITLIATDAGLLPAPVPLPRVTLGPGERAEVIVTLEAGEKAVLDTVAGGETIDDGSFPLLELRAAASLTPSPEVPAALGGGGPIAAPPGATVRRFRLQGHDAINGKGMDLTRIDEVVPAGTTEIWELENNVYSHNFHIHGVEFTVLDRDGRPPAPWETGRKDTVHVTGKSTVRVAVRFASYVDPASPYMYHCHILRHEDDGMMGQFVVVTPGTEAATARTLPVMSGMPG